MDIREGLLVAGKHLGKCLAGYRDDDIRSAARSAVDLAEVIFDAADEIDRLRAALQHIRDGYDRNDISHVDFGVGAYETALNALASPSTPALADLDGEK